MQAGASSSPLSRSVQWTLLTVAAIFVCAFIGSDIAAVGLTTTGVAWFVVFGAIMAVIAAWVAVPSRRSQNGPTLNQVRLQAIFTSGSIVCGAVASLFWLAINPDGSYSVPMLHAAWTVLVVGTITLCLAPYKP